MVQNPIHKKIGATFIPVSDIEKARDWYCDILSIEPKGEVAHGHIYVIPLEGGHNLVLDSKIFNQRSISEAPMFHFNTDDVEASYRFLKEKGVQEMSDIQHKHWFNFKDPDGNVLMVCRC